MTNVTCKFCYSTVSGENAGPAVRTAIDGGWSMSFHAGGPNEFACPAHVDLMLEDGAAREPEAAI
jgi:hypothetical protein